MADDDPIPVNLDLNLGPLDDTSGNNDPASVSYPTVIVNLDDWLHDPARRVREVVRQRNQRWRSLSMQLPIPQETQNLAMELTGVTDPPSGEGSAVPQQGRNEVTKVCENDTNHSEEKALNKNKDGGKTNADEGSYFDCNICLDLAKEPVVTCCGHLFCWPCLYRWLNHHSEAKECPVCKGEVNAKTVTPIYGSGSNTREPDLHSLKIPLRPQAQRVESWRQAVQRTAFTIPMEEMIRRLGTTFDLSRELTQLQSHNGEAPPRQSPDRANSVLNRLLTSRGVRRDANPIIQTDDIFELITESSRPNLEARDYTANRRLPSLLRRRSNSHRASNLYNLASAIDFSAEGLAAERLVDSYFHGSNGVDRNLDLTLPFDDRDSSVSSIAAVIHSESQTVDNAVEIDSTVALSTLSSRRRNDASRISDVDSGDSRANRRRRLN